ncbi:hypothetical protein Tcan_11157 [Toxocara canis]|uniref:Uncharacterized protein n=1 Tax=Toxocara canis TaxID=6265 RepID=A0A0B2VDK2_TOXCA|nr:hypothetical protein Tcan_11157 [Toxocara canis]
MCSANDGVFSMRLSLHFILRSAQRSFTRSVYTVTLFAFDTPIHWDESVSMPTSTHCSHICVYVHAVKKRKTRSLSLASNNTDAVKYMAYRFRFERRNKMSTYASVWWLRGAQVFAASARQVGCAFAFGEQAEVYGGDGTLLRGAACWRCICCTLRNNAHHDLARLSHNLPPRD